MPHQVTVTAQTGPARQLTAVVIPAVIDIDLALNDKRLFIQTDNAVGDNIKEFDLSSVTTFTATITAGNWAIVLS